MPEFTSGCELEPDPTATTYALSCPPHPTSPHIARDFVATVLRARRLDAIVDAAALCTSELVTNACVHAKGESGSALWVVVGRQGVRVFVFDGDEAPPVIRELGAEAWGEGGRGLWLVHALTEGRWGTSPAGLPAHGGLSVPTRPDGKAVWFDLPTPARPAG